MFKMLWDNRDGAPGNWLALSTGKSEKYFVWHWYSNLKNKQLITYLHTPIFRWGKNNASWSVGLALGKKFIDLTYHW